MLRSLLLLIFMTSWRRSNDSSAAIRSSINKCHSVLDLGFRSAMRWNITDELRSAETLHALRKIGCIFWIFSVVTELDCDVAKDFLVLFGLHFLNLKSYNPGWTRSNLSHLKALHTNPMKLLSQSKLLLLTSRVLSLLLKYPRLRLEERKSIASHLL